MLKMLLFHAINENVAVLTEDGHLPSFFVPNPGDLTAQESPLPGICHPRQKNANARGSPQEGGGGGSWAQVVELTDALLQNLLMMAVVT